MLHVTAEMAKRLEPAARAANPALVVLEKRLVSAVTVSSQVHNPFRDY